MPRSRLSLIVVPLLVLAGAASLLSAQRGPEVPAELQRWLVPQNWQRDTDGPVVSLGQPGDFDCTHIFAPCVARHEGRYLLWYSGSRGDVANRVFRLGLTTGPDGKRFDKHPDNPVFAFGDDEHSVLTPALLRGIDGAALRIDGTFRMWFSSTHFAGQSNLHTLHETASNDGVHWSPPSPAQLEDAYAPSVLKDGERYRLWYTDVSHDPWTIRHAASAGGVAGSERSEGRETQDPSHRFALTRPPSRQWRVTEQPVLVMDQPWERGRLFYPRVVKTGDVYLMWYGSYWSAHEQKTALGFAVSRDGLKWIKSPHNPVLRPDPSRPWESHYTTSQSVLRLPDGGFRIWYASRKNPPFVNKYYAINTAHWPGPER